MIEDLVWLTSENDDGREGDEVGVGGEGGDVERGVVPEIAANAVVAQ